MRRRFNCVDGVGWGSNNWISRDLVGAIAMAGFFVLDRLWLDARASQCGRTRSIYYRTPPGSGDIDFNVLGFGAFVLGEMHREQPILEFRFYFVAIGIIG